ncbi:putative membrane protein [Staphylococcus aureus]|nr:putative membrane protein [Staphylococcus aureus]
MNRKPELIMAWIANSISIIYLLVMGLSYFSLKVVMHHNVKN